MVAKVYVIVHNKISKIRKLPNKDRWEVLSESGKSLGTYNSQSEAKARLRQIEFFKNKEDYASEPKYFGDPPDFLDIEISSKYAKNNNKYTTEYVMDKIYMKNELKKLSMSLRRLRKNAESDEIEEIADSIETSSSKTPFLKDLKKVEDSNSLHSQTNEDSDLYSALESMLFNIKAMEVWFHGAHHVTGGVGFAGDHINLYSKIYEDISDDFDSAVEKAIGLLNEDIACPISIMDGANKIVSSFETPCGRSANEIAKIGLKIISEYIFILDEIYNSLKKSDSLTLGLDDFIMSMANDYEDIVYLLKQRSLDK